MNYMEFRPEEAQRVLREMERNHQVDYSGRRVYQRRIYQIVDALTFALTPTEEIKRDRKERAENKAKRERKARIQEARRRRPRTVRETCPGDLLSTKEIMQIENENAYYGLPHGTR